MRANNHSSHFKTLEELKKHFPNLIDATQHYSKTMATWTNIDQIISFALDTLWTKYGNNGEKLSFHCMSNIYDQDIRISYYKHQIDDDNDLSDYHVQFYKFLGNLEQCLQKQDVNLIIDDQTFHLDPECLQKLFPKSVKISFSADTKEPSSITFKKHQSFCERKLLMNNINVNRKTLKKQKNM